MAAKDRATRIQQKKQAEERLARRIDELKEKGKSQEQIKKDAVVRKYEALVKDAINRLNALDQKEIKVQQAKTAKLEKKAEPKVKKKDKKAAAKSDSKKKDKKSKKQKAT
ncbi:hypothetical protein ACFL27_06855 [candidate division CSSED10-310 bacterium]|uniref:Uncharacterized protein n=1 Tax=candidate division CSSED10-310 bacterium TaxID=2855610 RepID=A0ABV6YUM8_UNCC1